ncbi:hypothetical protein ACA910_006816 [Epithemia clementina (nom. ined.)]
MLRRRVASNDDHKGTVPGEALDGEAAHDEYRIVEVYSSPPPGTHGPSGGQAGGVLYHDALDTVHRSGGANNTGWEEHQDPEMDRDKPSHYENYKEDGSPGMNAIVGGSDERFIFQDASFPFRTVGRSSAASSSTQRGRSCTGTMVGPRLMLTARQCVNFLPGGGITSVKFYPAYYNGEHSFYGKASGQRVLYLTKDSSCVGYCSNAFDFVVVVLDSAIGNMTGYMGVKTFDESWLGGKYWDSVGYPRDLGNGRESVFFNNAAVLKTREYYDGYSVVMETDMDVNNGQWGSPLYGYWTESGYCVVGVVSSHDGSDDPDEWNNSAGGKMLTDLVLWARENYP